MRKIRYGFIGAGMLLCLATSATAGVSVGIGIGLPNISIGINLPLFPELVPVPGYPVYYAPGVAGNYFFYDGMYWVYQDDNWYASSWYNGPWGFVNPSVVPLYVLRVPVSYYRQPPVYFGSWAPDRAPRWGDHWGRSWEHRRAGWDRWNRSSAPPRAPLPAYQRRYVGDRYPRLEQQKRLRQQYRYQPRDKVVRQHMNQVAHKAPASQQDRGDRRQTSAPQERRHAAPQQRSAPQERQHSTQQQGVPAGHEQRGHRGGPNEQRNAPDHAQQRGPASHEQQRGPASHEQQRGPASHEQQRGPGSHEQQRGPGSHEQQRGPGNHEQQRGPASHEQRH